MRTFVTLLTILLLTALAPETSAMRKESLIFEHISIEDGLSENNVKSIVQDRNGFMWFGTKNGLNRFDGHDVRRYVCFDREKGFGNNNIDALSVDSEGNLWVGTDEGVFLFDMATERFHHIEPDLPEGDVTRNWVQAIECGDDGSMWVLIPMAGILRFNGEACSFYPLDKERGLGSHPYFTDICIDPTGTVWATTTGDGIYRYDAKEDRFMRITTTGDLDSRLQNFEKIINGGDGSLITGTTAGYLFRLIPSADNPFIEIPFSQGGKVYLRDMEKVNDELWIGTYQGLFTINARNEETHFTEDHIEKFGISDNNIFTLYRDRSNGIWIGSRYGGIDYMSDRPFRFYSHIPKGDYGARRVQGLAMDSDERIWMGTEHNDLVLFEPKSGTFRYLPSFANTLQSISTVESYNGTVYAGTTSSGLYRCDSPDNIVRLDYNTGVAGNSVYAYLPDSRGNEWIGYGLGLYKREAGSKEFRKVEATASAWIFDLFEAKDGRIWIATMGHGIYRYDPRSGEFTSYKADFSNPERGLLSNSVSSITESSDGRIWISTDRGGLTRYNPADDSFTNYGIREGLPDNVVYKVVEDKRHNLWFGTNRGLVKLNPADNSVKVFTTADGLPADQFCYNSAVKDKTGTFYFGTVNGIVSFDPLLDETATSEAPVFFTSLDIRGHSGKDAESWADEEGNIIYQDHLQLSYRDASFTLSVAAPNYGYIGQTLYSYRLKPVSKEWVAMEGNHISFTNLAPGSYDLEVMARTDGQTSVKNLHIEITPPWWRSTLAIIIYILLTIGGVALLFIWYRNYKERMMQERERNFSDKKEKEVYRAKVDFFTEIAHEIRTPLSLIDIPLEAVEGMEINDSKIRRYLHIIRENTTRLLQLTGQLLDFQKIDSHKLTLKIEHVNVTRLLKGVIERFEPTFTLSGKTLRYNLPEKDIFTAADKEALTKIVSNLINNAFKYSVLATEVTLAQDGDNCVITVCSDGKTITASEREKIFQPFYQTATARSESNGVGIGLPLSLTLARLSGGELRLADDTGDGLNRFVLSLPIATSLPEAQQLGMTERQEYLFDEESNLAKERQEGYTLLLVEDNDSIREMVGEQLRSDFFVETAGNGSEALKVLGEKHIDIVVTDIMMPVMDGMQLCEAIKGNPDMSHIPVVFITAKNDLESKIKGLQSGAEAYIEKPFSVKYLRQLIRSILDNRRREREAFSRKPLFDVGNMQMNKADEAFMKRVTEIINEHISEPEFNVESMTEILCMSRSNLLRKIKSLFNLSPSELIRVMKLKKAAQLIREGEYRVGEISEMVGIASPSYFSKIFYKQFNITPKDFALQCQNRKGVKDSEEEE